MSARDVPLEELAGMAGLSEIALRNRLEGRAPWDVEQLHRVVVDERAA